MVFRQSLVIDFFKPNDDPAFERSLAQYSSIF